MDIADFQKMQHDFATNNIEAILAGMNQRRLERVKKRVERIEALRGGTSSRTS